MCSPAALSPRGPRTEAGAAAGGGGSSRERARGKGPPSGPPAPAPAQVSVPPGSPRGSPGPLGSQEASPTSEGGQRVCGKGVQQALCRSCVHTARRLSSPILIKRPDLRVLRRPDSDRRCPALYFQLPPGCGTQHHHQTWCFYKWDVPLAISGWFEN